MASISDSGASRWTYDVFLSFKGNDIRKGFTGHLYAALCRSGINTFVDEEKMEYSQETEASLKGIKESRLSLVLLSEDYASSVWCLEELVQILKCKKPDDVWPIFYDVDPSHVEEIKGSYQLAFVKHEERFKEDMIKEWKAALRQVSMLKGLDLQKHLDGHEANNVEHIVKEISRRIDQLPLSVAIHPVGLHFRAKQVISLIADAVEDIRIVVIYGMGGIGKSTLAKMVYNFLFQKYDCSCFLANVREVSKSKSITYLQRQLLSETLKRKHEKIDNVDSGLNFIIQSLSQKKVLLVLDDVDELHQIHQILGNWNWLLKGSTVIITTRMKSFLQPSNNIYQQYEVVGLGVSDSLKLLSLHAFGKNQPPNKFMDCAEKIVHYAGGVPLALEVLGSSLCGQSVEVWNSRLEKLKVIANDDIHSKLRISYDSLSNTEKYIFLDIACFFIGYDKDYVISILDGCNFFPIDGFNTLLRRCLVKVGSNNKLSMHDLIRSMGRETVRQEHAIDPGERSRLWHPEDIIDVLTYKMGTKAIEGLVLSMPRSENSWSTKAFNKMKMLRLLQLNNVRLTGSYEYVSNKLRWLCWRDFPLPSIPLELGLEYLVALDMRYSKLKQFSEEVKSLKKLKFLNLNHSLDLVETPNFEDCARLEKLMFKECISLDKVHHTIALLKSLRLLSFQDCKSLKNLPSIDGLITLENLNMSGCSKLEAVPESIGHLSHLIFCNFQNCMNLKNLPESIGCLKSLQEMNMSGCSKLEELPESTGFLTCLILLNLHDCQNLKKLPESIGNLKALGELDMSGCAKLEDLPESAGCFSSLRIWDLQDCKNLKSFPHNIYGLRSLEKLNLSGCSTLEYLAEDLGNLKSLVVLKLDGTALSTLPKTIENLKDLQNLSLRECRLVFSPRKCPSIISFLPNSLKELDISFCKILDGVMPQDLQGLPQLIDLKLCGNEFTSLPASIGSLPKLVNLSLDNCRWLKSIPQLQSSLGSLSAKLCPSLESIDLRNVNRTANLQLNGCESLKVIEGYYNLEPLAFEIAERLLRNNSTSMKDLIKNTQVCRIDNLTVTGERCPIETLSARGIYSLVMPGIGIPTWFSHQSDGDSVYLQVPPLNPDSKIIGIVTCAIYAGKRTCTSYFFRYFSKKCRNHYLSPYIAIINRTKMFYWEYTPCVTFLSSEIEQDISLFCYWMFNNLKEEIDDEDMCWRFKDAMEEGDEVEFSFDVGYGIEVKKCGMHLLYSDSHDDLATVSSAASRHHKSFLGSRPRLLTVAGNQELKLADNATGVPDDDVEFKEWVNKRDLQVNSIKMI